MPDRKRALLGPPTERFRDNLRNDTKYLTSWISSGWTNDVITYGNIIYMAMLTERVPIIGPFTVSHAIAGRMDAGDIHFGEVFDMDYLSQAIGTPVLEWHEVKNSSSTEVEDIGCWSIWQAVQTREPDPRNGNALALQGLDISFTAAPTSIQIIPGYEHDPHARFWTVASLLYSPDKEEAMKRDPQPSKVHGVVLPPDDHLACFDYLYYLCAHTPFEYNFDVGPAWRFVLKHLRWTKRLQAIGDHYLKVIFNVPEHEPVPPYIAIHARRNDFHWYCNDVPLDECYPSIPVFQRRIREIQEEVQERHGYTPRHVVMLSDERDPAWWDSIREVGWYTTASIVQDTQEKHGGWYPLLVDAVIQSSGIGFIGTTSSTMSVLAGRRVEAWYDGVFKLVKWGSAHADDH